MHDAFGHVVVVIAHAGAQAAAVEQGGEHRVVDAGSTPVRRHHFAVHVAGRQQAHGALHTGLDLEEDADGKLRVHDALQAGEAHRTAAAQEGAVAAQRAQSALRVLHVELHASRWPNVERDERDQPVHPYTEVRKRAR